MLKLDEWSPGVGEEPEIVGEWAGRQRPDPEVRQRPRRLRNKVEWEMPSPRSSRGLACGGD